MEVLEQIFPKWSCIEILDKVAEGKHYDLMQKLNIEYHKKLLNRRKKIAKIKSYTKGGNKFKLFNYLAMVYNFNKVFYTTFYDLKELGFYKYEQYDEHMKYKLSICWPKH